MAMPASRAHEPQASIWHGVSGDAVPALVMAASEALSDTLAYDRVVERFAARFRAARTHTAHDMWSTLDGTVQDMLLEGALVQPEADLLKECVCRDLAHMASVRVRGDREQIDAMEALAAEQGSCGALNAVLRLSGDAVYRIAGESRRTELRRAGEATCAGTLACTRCDAVSLFQRSASLTNCGACGAAVFTKALRM